MKIGRQTSHGAEMKIDLKNTEWVTDIVNNLIENKTDTRMDGKDKYMALIPKEWTNMSNCARRNLVPGERTEA
nr:hypothetical protein [Tanacetum cinerariifolium]